MYVKHLGADMLLHRARQVLGRLESAEHDYLASLHLQQHEADGTTRVRIATPPPPELVELGGDVVRACRAALDDLAVSLAVASRRAPRDTTFPIAADVRAYPEVESHCLRHANQEARRAVRSVTPWKGGDDVLWDLHQLHTSGDLVVDVGQVVELGPTRVPSPLGVLQPGAQGSRTCRLLRDGSLVTDPVAPLRLVLTYGEPTRTRPLVPTLTMLVTHVATVIARVVGATGHSRRTGG